MVLEAVVPVGTSVKFMKTAGEGGICGSLVVVGRWGWAGSVEMVAGSFVQRL